MDLNFTMSVAILKCQIISNFVLSIEQSKEFRKEQSKALSQPLNYTIISAFVYKPSPVMMSYLY